MRLAIFQAGIPLQSYTRDLINGLVKAGCSVDLYTASSADKGFIDIGTIDGKTILMWEGGQLGRLLNRLRCKLAQVFCIPFPANNPVTRLYLRCLPLNERQYDLLIGVDKLGLALAGHIRRRLGIPMVYYSLELYLDDHPFVDSRWQRAEEIANHREAIGTIIQDRFRWSVLSAANGIDGTHEVFYLPVGLRGRQIRPQKLRLFRSKNGIPDDAFVLCYFGKLSKHRYADALVAASAKLPANTYIVLHGPVEKDFRATCKSDLPKNVVLSTKLVSEDELYDLVTSCDVGLALYRTDVANDRLTAFSSQKIALYLQSGLPIIAFRSESYELLARSCSCAELIDSIDDLPFAVQSIRKQYSTSADEAKRAYSMHYDLENLLPLLGEYLRRLQMQQTEIGRATPNASS